MCDIVVNSVHTVCTVQFSFATFSRQMHVDERYPASQGALTPACACPQSLLSHKCAGSLFYRVSWFTATCIDDAVTLMQAMFVYMTFVTVV